MIDFSEIKLIVSEIDGVLTEHTAGIGEFNSVLFKQFCMKDFEAINEIKKNWNFVFMSSDAAINMSLCKKKNIPFFYAERSKTEIFSKLTQRFNLTPDNVLYIGSSYSDLECMKMCNMVMCPDDAVTPVKSIASYIVPVYGGLGVISYLYDMLYEYKIEHDRQ